MEFDFLKPDELAVLKLRKLFEDSGYKKYKVSRFEEYKLYLENQSFLPDKHIITFTDLDGKLLALKPDATLSIAKNTNASYDSTEKLYYTENVYRVSKESRSFREINQMGLEYLGKVDSEAVREVISLAAASLSEISPDSVLAVSHMGFTVELVNQASEDPFVRSEILGLISAKNAHGLKQLGEKHGFDGEHLANFAAIYGNAKEALCKAERFVSGNASKTALDELRSACSAPDGSCAVTLDFSIVNDADYYNGIIFQGYIKGLPRMVLSGGRYDSIMHRMGKDADAIGFALYLDELERGAVNNA